MKKFLPLLFLTATLCGASVDFRSGKILCAELSANCPAGLKKIDPLLYPDLPENKMYAAVTVLCRPGRKLSVFDYSIEQGLRFRCVAVQEEGKAPSLNFKQDYPGEPRKKYTMFFILDAGRIYPADEELTLKANFPPEQRLRVRFRRTGDKPFTAPGAIPVSGLMPEK